MKRGQDVLAMGVESTGIPGVGWGELLARAGRVEILPMQQLAVNITGEGKGERAKMQRRSREVQLHLCEELPPAPQYARYVHPLGKEQKFLSSLRG
eukprot:757593-Hanusia_phi.AAC.3